MKETEYFAAANSGEGFVSYYDAIFGRSEITRRYLIKGGPGTGKSSLIRACAARAEERGASVEYYRCSSDPDSLDGAVIGGRIAILDATAPHAVEASLPGVRDELVDLGRFWDSSRLRTHREEILTLDRQKRMCYQRAYGLLSAARTVERGMGLLVDPFIKHEKMDRAVEGLMKNAGEGRSFSVLPGMVDSIGMKGRVRLTTYERSARILIRISDHYETAGLFLSRVLEEARRRSLAVQVSYRLVDPRFPEVILLSESGVCFSLQGAETESASSVINMKRFLELDRLASVRGEYREEKRMRDRLLLLTESVLSRAGVAHLALEQIYGSCMDFDALGAFVGAFADRIL